MKKVWKLLIAVIGICLLQSGTSYAYDYGDYKSGTLVQKAWDALEKKDYDVVRAYARKCIETYGDIAKDMQAKITDYPSGNKEEMSSYWALNDIATILFVEAESYRLEDNKSDAIQTYNKIIKDYTYGQAWDEKGFFWKPAEVAVERIRVLENKEAEKEFDPSAADMVVSAWKAYNTKNFDRAIEICEMVLKLHGDEAKRLQKSLSTFPKIKSDIFSYGVLNDVGTCMWIAGDSCMRQNRLEEAKKYYLLLVNEFSYTQCYDPRWDGFWNPTERALRHLANVLKVDIEDLNLLGNSPISINGNKLIFKFPKGERIYILTSKKSSTKPSFTKPFKEVEERKVKYNPKAIKVAEYVMKNFDKINGEIKNEESNLEIIRKEGIEGIERLMKEKSPTLQYTKTIKTDGKVFEVDFYDGDVTDVGDYFLGKLKDGRVGFYDSLRIEDKTDNIVLFDGNIDGFLNRYWENDMLDIARIPGIKGIEHEEWSNKDRKKIETEYVKTLDILVNFIDQEENKR